MTRVAPMTKKATKFFVKLRPVLLGIDENFLRNYARTIGRNTTTLERIAEQYCNDDMSDRERRRVEAKEERCEKNISEILAYLSARTGVKLTPYFGGDPRGPQLCIKLPVEYRHIEDHPEGLAICT